MYAFNVESIIIYLIVSVAVGMRGAVWKVIFQRGSEEKGGIFYILRKSMRGKSLLAFCKALKKNITLYFEFI